MLNLLLKTIQKELCRKHARVGNDTENTQACNGQRERLWGMLPPPTKTTSWKSRSYLLLIARLSTCRENMEQLPPSRLLKHNYVLPQTIWGNISGFYRILVQYFVHEQNVYLGFTIQKKINSTQFIEPLKVKTTSISINNMPSCDLLEKSYFCSITNNIYQTSRS